MARDIYGENRRFGSSWILALIMVLIGAISIGKIYNLLPFSFEVEDSILLLATSVSSIIGGIYILLSGLRRGGSSPYY